MAGRTRTWNCQSRACGLTGCRSRRIIRVWRCVRVASVFRGDCVTNVLACESPPCPTRFVLRLGWWNPRLRRVRPNDIPPFRPTIPSPFDTCAKRPTTSRIAWLKVSVGAHANSTNAHTVMPGNTNISQLEPVTAGKVIGPWNLRCTHLPRGVGGEHLAVSTWGTFFRSSTTSTFSGTNEPMRENVIPSVCGVPTHGAAQRRFRNRAECGIQNESEVALGR